MTELAPGDRLTGPDAAAVAFAWGVKDENLDDVTAVRRGKSLGCRIVEHADGFWECRACGNCGVPFEEDA